MAHRLIDQRAGLFAGVFRSHQCYEGRLALLAILAQRLASQCLVPLHVAQVVGDLDGEADIAGIGAQLRAAFDPANFVHCGVDPLAEAWPLLDEYTDYFHIKDKEATSGRVVPAGRGDGGVAELLARAVARGFDGFLSIEPHLKADDPDYGGDGPQRCGKAVAGLREVLGRAGIAEA